MYFIMLGIDHNEFSDLELINSEKITDGGVRNCYLFYNKETELICIDFALANELCIIFNGSHVCYRS